jgi:molecular chaperone DnaJ
MLSTAPAHGCRITAGGPGTQGAFDDVFDGVLGGMFGGTGGQRVRFGQGGRGLQWHPQRHVRGGGGFGQSSREDLLVKARSSLREAQQ